MCPSKVGPNSGRIIILFPGLTEKNQYHLFPRCLELVGTFYEMSGGNIRQGLSNTKFAELERKNLRKYERETGLFL